MRPGLARALHLGLALLAACSSPPRAVVPAREAELREQLSCYYRDFSARDWEAYRKHFWPSATLTTVWQPRGEPAPRVVLTPIEDFLAHTAEGPDSQPIFEERMLTAEMELTGNVAQVWAHYEARFGSADAVQTWRGIDAFTWMQHEGEWRIVSLAYGDLPGEERGAP